ncbi:MAG: 2,3-bisphosphoglycerate-independent phosphoglycerate mutase [Planctomycetota bacterium]
MDTHALIKPLLHKNESKIVMFVADGLGGLPQSPGGMTELETAKTPHLDKLATEGVLGSSIPVAPGIAPGSGPGHLGLFGFDPVKFMIGRGALEATGIGFKLQPGDVAIRANFCTIDKQDNIVDRRAGRLPTDESAPIAESLRSIELPGIELFVEPVKEHRFVIVLRGEGLGGAVADTDPQATGVTALEPRALEPGSEKTAKMLTKFLKAAHHHLKDQPKANFCTLRGITNPPSIQTYEQVYGLRAAAIAVYPMYKGLAQLVGMDVIGAAQTLDDQVQVLKEKWDAYDFFFIHFKYTDSTGEDGDFDAKVKRTEEFDAAVPRIMELAPDVFIATGDHSTPAMLASHSWHPVPTLLWAKNCRCDGATSFGERECLTGGLGQFEAKHLMTLALANAGRLAKFGA